MTPSILLATPVYGTINSASVAVGHHLIVAGMIRDTHFTLAQAVFGTDLVRARSRLVRQFLHDGDWTHLLFWDADITLSSVAQAGSLLRRLVESGKPIIGCTYPMKRVHFDRLDKVDDGADPESKVYEYPLHLAADTKVTDGCMAVEGVPLGFTLITRDTLELMCAHYVDALGFDDIVDGQPYPTVALFQLALIDRTLWGEDYSFCWRARQIGIQPWLWVGPGCELGHVGTHLFQGRRDGFVRGE